MRHTIQTILAGLCLMLLPHLGYAEQSALLTQLNEARKQRPISLELHEQHNKKGELTHLGIALFNKAHQEVINPYLWRGAERMLLELLLKENDAARLKWLKERNVRLFIDTTPFGTKGFTSFSKAIPILKYVSSLKINEDAERYRLLVKGGSSDQVLRLSFPKDRELIYGTDKKEEDERQGEMIMNYKGSLRPIFTPEAGELVPTSMPNIYHSIGQALYIDSLRTDCYYHVDKANNTVTPVYSTQYPKESLCNLLLGKVARNEIKVHVTHKQYGNKYIEWTADWNRLLAALCSEEVIEPFAAVQYSAERKQLTGVLILRNIAFGYNNMLLLSFPSEQLDSNSPATLEGMLYTNIPQHNILALFEEITPVRANNQPKQVYNHPLNK